MTSPSSKILYKSGYKYQLDQDYTVQTDVKGYDAINHDFIYLTGNGWLAIKAGYAWDGCSGPTVDCKKSMRASLVHDALYQLGREGLLPPSSKEAADREFYKILLEDGFNWFRALAYYWAVLEFGFSAFQKQPEEVHTAP